MSQQAFKASFVFEVRRMLTSLGWWARVIFVFAVFFYGASALGWDEIPEGGRARIATVAIAPLLLLVWIIWIGWSRARQGPELAFPLARPVGRTTQVHARAAATAFVVVLISAAFVAGAYLRAPELFESEVVETAVSNLVVQGALGGTLEFEDPADAECFVEHEDWQGLNTPVCRERAATWHLRTVTLTIPPAALILTLVLSLGILSAGLFGVAWEPRGWSRLVPLALGLGGLYAVFNRGWAERPWGPQELIALIGALVVIGYVIALVRWVRSDF